jgi:hypothetical protein
MMATTSKCNVEMGVSIGDGVLHKQVLTGLASGGAAKVSISPAGGWLLKGARVKESQLERGLGCTAPFLLENPGITSQQPVAA